MILAASILLFWMFIPAGSWGMSSHLWLVPVILTMQTSLPFFVAGVVARLVARQNVYVSLAVLWVVFWVLSIWWLTQFNTASELVLLNAAGMLGSLVAILCGSWVAGLLSRQAPVSSR